MFVALPCLASGNDFLSKAINSWYGYSFNSFVKIWGYPDRQTGFGDNKLYYWNIVNNTNTTTYHFGTNSSTTYNNYGKEIIEVNDKNLIVGGQYNGNDCPFSYLLNHDKYVNPDNDPWQIEKELKRQNKRKLEKHTWLYGASYQGVLVRFFIKILDIYF